MKQVFLWVGLGIALLFLLFVADRSGALGNRRITLPIGSGGTCPFGFRKSSTSTCRQTPCIGGVEIPVCQFP